MSGISKSSFKIIMGLNYSLRPSFFFFWQSGKFTLNVKLYISDPQILIKIFHINKFHHSASTSCRLRQSFMASMKKKSSQFTTEENTLSFSRDNEIYYLITIKVFGIESKKTEGKRT